MPLFAILTLVTLAAIGGRLAIDWEPRLLPIRTVSIAGELRSMSHERLRAAIEGRIRARGGILSQNLRELQAEVAALPWVEQASLRRIWPDRIEVRIVERTALARWGEDGLVTIAGTVFRPDDGRVPAGLPRFDGGDDTQAPAVVARYLDWEPRLSALGLLIDQLAMDARGAWSLTLLGGTELQFGTARVPGEVDARLARLLAIYPRIEALGLPERIDLRYSNGIAVRFHGGAAALPVSQHPSV